jgi:hypothetical protein
VVRRRRFPYPYRAALAICSDLDETADAQVYAEQMRFLNTREQTSMGPGIGLEVGNSIYFDMPPGQFAYWTTDDAGREMARALIRSGHIDCLHSYGDLATTRAHAVRALEELERHQLSLKVWIDHAQAATNFGADIMQGHGDEPGHAAYHADLTLRHGIRYVWRGRVTSIVGQDQPLSFGGVWNAAHWLQSSRTLAKEAAKQVLGRCGNQKYSFHARNRTISRSTLRDRQPVVEFMRCNPHHGGVSSCDTGYGVSEVLTPRFLDRLLARRGVCILYTHLGKLRGRGFDDRAVRAFRALAGYASERQLLVTTTRRLLDYSLASQGVTASISSADSGRIITVHGDATASELQGMTFYVDDPENVEVRLNGDALPVQVNQCDETGQRSVTIPWCKLSFPEFKKP